MDGKKGDKIKRTVTMRQNNIGKNIFESEVRLYILRRFKICLPLVDDI